MTTNIPDEVLRRWAAHGSECSRELLQAREAIRGLLDELQGYAHGDEPAAALGVWSKDGEYLGQIASNAVRGDVDVVNGRTATTRHVSDLYGAPYIEAARACLPEGG